MELFKILKMLRTHYGISQLELSKKIKCSCASISLIEKGKNPVTLTTIRKYSEAFGVSASAIVLLSEKDGEKDAFLKFDQSRLLLEKICSWNEEKKNLEGVGL